jgi:hypothetical protein
MSFAPAISLYDAMTDAKLFGKVFGAESFWTWRTCAKLIDGIPLIEPREVALYQQATGRTRLPAGPVTRWYGLCGRRAGKDRWASAVACWMAALAADWRRYMSAGEQAVVLLLGADRKQASILRRYCSGLLEAPLLKREVTRITESGIVEFRNGACLEVATNSAALVRGRSAVAIIGSEVAHWRTDEASASSDEEVHNAALPSLAMTPGGGLVLFQSSVFRKRGLMFRKWKELHGRDDADDLCWFADSATMNPKLPARVIDKALAEDAVKSGAEFLNRWREDVSDFCPLDVLEACTDFQIVERPPQDGISYTAFADAAGGTGSDSFTLAIAHREHDKAASVLVDLVRERKPRFVPSSVISEYAALLKSYNITEIESDKFAGGFHSSEWEANGIRFRPCERTTSENYQHALPLLLSGRVRLVNVPKLRTQFASLERRIQGVSGREAISHPAVGSAHDDVCCAVAGAMVAAGNRYAYDLTALAAADGDDGGWQALRLWNHIMASGGAPGGGRWF